MSTDARPRKDAATVGTPLRHLARLYSTAAGFAFASGKDEEAVKLRQGADALLVLAATLPELPGPVSR